MSCYFRHMKDVLDEVGVEVTPKNKKAVDRVIHELVDIEYKDCSPAWKEVKGRLRADPSAREAFVGKLASKLKAAGLV
jgi:hypothetical protein